MAVVSLRPFPFPVLLTLCLFLLAQRANSQTPTAEPFTFVNAGKLVRGAAEYGASYREVRTTAAYNLSAFPFALCLYDTTPGAYILAVRGGDRWVWEANRRSPVGEYATLSLRRDGNLVLADRGGASAWETNTAGRGITGIRLLENGNLILHDKAGNPIWQSFDHPTDTLLAGMSLRLNSRGLVSRKSAADASDGPYSLVLADQGITLYLNYSGELIRYADIHGYSGDNVTFTTRKANSTSYEVILRYEGPPPGTSVGGLTRVLKSVDYDATYSFLRLSSDGNLIALTYLPPAASWVQSFAYYTDYSTRPCTRPARCGAFGLCANDTCVACPSQKGLSPWTPGCAPPQLGSCAGGGGGERVRYYRVEGAEHFLTLLQSAEAMKLRECRERCSNDCKCRGFVHQRRDSLCLFVPVLATLIGESPEYTVYVKYLK